MVKLSGDRTFITSHTENLTGSSPPTHKHASNLLHSNSIWSFFKINHHRIRALLRTVFVQMMRQAFRHNPNQPNSTFVRVGFALARLALLGHPLNRQTQQQPEIRQPAGREARTQAARQLRFRRPSEVPAGPGARPRPGPRDPPEPDPAAPPARPPHRHSDTHVRGPRRTLQEDRQPPSGRDKVLSPRANRSALLQTRGL